MKIVAWILIASVLIMFITLPAAMFGGITDNVTDTTVNYLDAFDGSDDFTPQKVKGQSIGGKVIDAFDSSGRK